MTENLQRYFLKLWDFVVVVGVVVDVVFNYKGSYLDERVDCKQHLHMQ